MARPPRHAPRRRGAAGYQADRATHAPDHRRGTRLRPRAFHPSLSCSTPLGPESGPPVKPNVWRVPCGASSPPRRPLSSPALVAPPSSAPCCRFAADPAGRPLSLRDGAASLPIQWVALCPWDGHPGLFGSPRGSDSCETSRVSQCSVFQNLGRVPGGCRLEWG